MGLSIEEILLQVRSDGDQARRDLQETAAELNGFDRQEAEAELRINSANAKAEFESVRADLASFARESAEATADVDATRGKAVLDELQRRLSAIDREDISPEVEVKIAKALIDVEALHARLEALDREDVNVDVDVKRGVVERFSALTGEVGRLSGALDGGGGGGGLTSSLAGAGGEAESLGGSLGGATGPAIALGAVFAGPLVGAIVALAASLAEALAGAGALAIALSATLLPAIALAVGAIVAFKDGGAVVEHLKDQFDRLADAFKNTLAPAANIVFRGLIGALKEVTPLINSLKPAFTVFGKAARESIDRISAAFTDKRWQNFFDFLIRSTAKLSGPITGAFIAFSDVLRNIAKASMPFLIHGFKELAHWLQGLASDTQNIHALRRGIAPLVGALKVWLEFSKQLGRVFLGLVRDSAAPGERLVHWLTKGAQALADWLDSKEGQRQVARFFKETLPVVKDLVGFFGHLVVAWLKLSQALAPVTRPFILALTQLLDLVGRLADLFDKLPAPIRKALGIGIAAPILIGVQAINTAIDAVEALVKAFQDPEKAARDTWKAIKTIFNRGITIAIGIVKGLPGAASDVWKAIKGVMRRGIVIAISIVKGLVDAAAGIWGAIKGVMRRGITIAISIVKGLVEAASDIWRKIKGVMGQGIEIAVGFISGLLEKAKSVWDSIKGFFGSISIPVHFDVDPIPHPNIPGIGRVVAGGPTATIPTGGPNFGGLAAAVGNAAARSVARAAGAPLARGTLAAPGAAVAAAGPTYHETIQVTAIDGGMPDPEQVAGRIALRRRQRGRR